jgi:hypothetical protein
MTDKRHDKWKNRTFYFLRQKLSKFAAQKHYMQLPKFLYRGDDDKKGYRKLRVEKHITQLTTNMINGGDGSKIFKEPVWKLINEHVLSRYLRSDFLSFTADKRAAYRFGMDLQSISDELIEEGCEAYYEDEKDWDFCNIFP